MKILFIGLCAAYTDGMSYQDQLLSKQCLEDGNEVFFISDAHKFELGKIVDTDESFEVLDNGLHLIRLKYDFVINRYLTNKLRKCDRLLSVIEKIEPDVIYMHCPNTLAIYKVAEYLDKNPIPFFVDSHTDFYTSGTNIISRQILHKVIYKACFTKALHYAKELFCVSVNCMRFANEIYGIPDNKLRLFSLGGLIIERNSLMRKNIREYFGTNDNTIIFLQAGKIDKRKCLLEVLSLFVNNTDQNWEYWVVGDISIDIKPEFERMMNKDSRIKYLGWKTAEEIFDVFQAVDVYVQPGKVSALAQNAICSGLPIVLNDLEDYRPFVKGNGWLIDNPEKINKVFDEIKNNKVDLTKMSEKSYSIARDLLDYKKLARMIY